MQLSARQSSRLQQARVAGGRSRQRVALVQAKKTADGPSIAIVGVTGAVGQEFLQVCSPTTATACTTPAAAAATLPAAAAQVLLCNWQCRCSRRGTSPTAASSCWRVPGTQNDDDKQQQPTYDIGVPPLHSHWQQQQMRGVVL